MPRRGGRRAHRAHHRRHHHHHHHGIHHHHRPRRIHFRAHTGGRNTGIQFVGQPVQCTASCCRVVFAVLLVLAGFIMTMVGNFAEPFWGPEQDDWCSFCKEERLRTERNLRNCRIAGPILIGIGVILLIVLRRMKRQGENSQAQSSSEVHEGSEQPSAAAADTSNQMMTGVIVHQPPLSDNTASGMPGFTYPQPPYPTVTPTAPYPPNAGGDFAYPPSTAQFSFPTAVESEPPPPSYEAAVAAPTVPMAQITVAKPDTAAKSQHT